MNFSNINFFFSYSKKYLHSFDILEIFKLNRKTIRIILINKKTNILNNP